ncbi:MAG TPA: hypothetical protein VLT84_04680, partial [Acidobacteriota bacterium]|nr:hypothetical protein [Acidobacteriota bacterium]
FGKQAGDGAAFVAVRLGLEQLAKTFDIETDNERTPAEAVSFLPRVRLSPEESARLRHGAPPSIDAERIERGEEPGPLPPGASGWPLALLDGAGTLLALAHPWDEQPPGLPLRLQRVLVGD